MKIIKNDLLILDLLERANVKMTDYSTGSAFSFDHEGDFHLVVFSADDRSKGFSLFIVGEYEHNLSEFEMLKAELEQMDGYLGEAVVNDANEEIEKTAFRLRAKNLFYDAH